MMMSMEISPTDGAGNALALGGIELCPQAIHPLAFQKIQGNGGEPLMGSVCTT